jgi:hypothetical protein
MSSDRLTSRRAFAVGAGLVASAAIASTAQAGPHGNRREELNKLSKALHDSPSERRAFVADPRAYVSKMGLHSVSDGELTNLQHMYADGFCCMGCGCS